jgi:methionyl-tRNA formyltransferase
MLIKEGYNVTAVYAPIGDKLFEASVLNSHPCDTVPAGLLRAESLPAGTDLIVAAHSHDFVGIKTRNATALGAIGYHPSLLPLHRGRDAVRWTVRMNDRVTGGSVYWLTDTVDGGPIAAQDWCFVEPGETASELWREKLFPMGVRLLRETCRDIANGILVKKRQDPALATWEPSIDGAPPLHRPELAQIGFLPDGYTVTSDLNHRSRREG